MSRGQLDNLRIKFTGERGTDLGLLSLFDRRVYRYVGGGRAIVSGLLLSGLLSGCGVSTDNNANRPPPPTPPDTLTGTDRNDSLTGEDGDSTIRGLGGDDVLRGEGGNDKVFGGTGEDILHGANGNDELNGGTDDDRLFGGNNNDMLRGEAGHDRLYGDVQFSSSTIPADSSTWSRRFGSDELDGGEGDDFLEGGNSNDMLMGGAGDDRLIGDILNPVGGNGADTLLGEDGHDSLFGGGGNDMLDGGEGDDSLSGGTGNDTFAISAGQDRITDYESGDSLDFDANFDDVDIGTLSIMRIAGTNHLRINGYGESGDALILDGIFRPSENVEGEVIGWLSSYAATESSFSGAFIGLLPSGQDDETLQGNDMEDTITLMTSDMRLRLFGFDGDDSLIGNGSANVLYGGNGDDTLNGRGGHDTLYGGGGADTITGGVGDDTLYGDAGDDALHGNSGKDTIYGGSGADTITGGVGDDTLYGDAGDDALHGNSGKDTIYGGSGADTITGGVGDDILHGDSEGDTLNGDVGNDELYGGTGNDDLDGGADNDTLYGGSGNDRFIVSAGMDTIMDFVSDVFSGGQRDVLDFSDSFSTTNIADLVFMRSGNNRDGNDLEITGFGSNNKLTLAGVFADGGAFADDTEAEAIVRLTSRTGILEGLDDDGQGTSGNNTLTATANMNDPLFGFQGNDELTAHSGGSTLYGGDGNDELNGAAGVDKLYGGGDDDMLNGDAGHDELYGGGDRDRLDGGAGNDTLSGGEGNDTFIVSAGEDTITDFELGESLDFDMFKDGENDTLGTAFEALSVGRVSGSDDFRITGFGNGNTLTLQGVFADGGAFAGRSDTDAETRILAEILKTIITLGNTAVTGVPPAAEDRVYVYGSTIGDALTFAAAGTEDNTAYGGDGNDNLSGGGGNDRLFGGDDGDTLDGGDDDDVLHGGSGADTFTVSKGDDVIVDFTTSDRLDFDAFAMSGSDIDFNQLSFVRSGNNRDGNDLEITGFGESGDNNKLTLAGVFADGGTFSGRTIDYVVYRLAGISDNVNSLLENVAGIPEGDDLDNAVTGMGKVFGFNGKDTLTADTNGGTLHGGNGDDELNGGAGSDWLYGGSGNDRLNGGAEDDMLYGGAGNDVLNGDAGADRLYGGAGTDTITAGVGDDMLYGGDGNDVLRGGGGADTLDGGSENDNLEGGVGGDTFIVSSGTDTIEDFTSRSAEGIDKLDFSSFSINIGDLSFAQEVNNLRISGFSGSSGVILEAFFSSAARSGAGNLNDFLDIFSSTRATAADADRSIYRYILDGADLFSGQGTDAADGTMSSYVEAESGIRLYGFGGNDFLRAHESGSIIYGGEGDDNLSGDDGSDSLYGGMGSDTLNGGGGADTLDGGDGNDMLTGDSGNNDAHSNDTFIVSGGSDTITDFVSDNSLRGERDILDFSNISGANIEDLVFTRSGSGSGDDLEITGFGSGNTLTLSGVFATGGTFADDTEAEAIIKLVSDFSRAFAGLGSEHNFNDSNNTTPRSLPADDARRLYGFGGDDELDGDDGADILYGGDGDDRLDGDGGVDMLYGGAGTDTIMGGSGNDIIYGGADRDIIDGEVGADELYGGGGGDTLNGGSGNDTLEGGRGNDTLEGGSGNDAFVIRGDAEHDVILDFNVANDDLDILGYTGLAMSDLEAIFVNGDDLQITFEGNYGGATATVTVTLNDINEDNAYADAAAALAALDIGFT